MNQPRKVLQACEVDLKIRPHRFHLLFGAARAADQLGQADQAIAYYRQLLAGAGTATSDRPGVRVAHHYLKE